MSTKRTGVAGMEATVTTLQRAIDAVNEAAGYFEDLRMFTQVEQLDSALDAIEDVQDLLGVFLGTVELDSAAQKQRKPSKKPAGKALRFPSNADAA